MFATILVFLLIGGFARLEKVIGILDPKDITSKDFNYSDLAYNLLGKRNATLVDTGIVIVNIGLGGRDKIDSVIQKITSYHPKRYRHVIYCLPRQSLTLEELTMP